jgi:glucosamine-6-phosphate deaminase
MANPVLRVFDDERELGTALSDEILDGIESAAIEGRGFVLGCPGGRSLRSTYRALGESARRRDTDLGGLTIAMMDDYLEMKNGSFDLVAEDRHFSCRRFAYEEIIGPLQGLRGAPGRDRVLFPQPTDAPAYDQQLEDEGGIDLFLLASGASDGHVAFNPPGSAVDSATRIVELADTTRSDNLYTFPDFSGLSEVPTHGVTIGLGSISRLSRSVALVCSGEHKRRTVAHVLSAQDFDLDWPATIIHACADGQILVDKAAYEASDFVGG